MGANQWRHAPSIAAMSPSSRRYYLSPEPEGELRLLREGKPAGDASVELSVDFADRKDAEDETSYDLLDERLDTRNAVAFSTPPFAEPAEVSGLFTGTLDFVVNKKDLDISIDLFEKLPSGEFLQLSVGSAYLRRASYARSRTERHLLEPGKEQKVEFRSERLVSRQLQKGSRLVMVLSVAKGTGQQINYGSGQEVSDESIADAGEPLKVRWLGTSFLDLPMSR
jgi:predicted acyl esterase